MTSAAPRKLDLIYGVTRAKLSYFVCYFFLIRFKIVSTKGYPFGNTSHFRLFKAARGNGGSADSQSACYKRALRVVRHRVFIRGNMHLVKPVLKLLSGDAVFNKLKKNKMIICPARYYIKALP